MRTVTLRSQLESTCNTSEMRPPISAPLQCGRCHQPRPSTQALTRTSAEALNLPCFQPCLCRLPAPPPCAPAWDPREDVTCHPAQDPPMESWPLWSSHRPLQRLRACLSHPRPFSDHCPPSCSWVIALPHSWWCCWQALSTWKALPT